MGDFREKEAGMGDQDHPLQIPLPDPEATKPCMADVEQAEAEKYQFCVYSVTFWVN